MNDYLLADDLSGALEAGAAFRQQGRRVKLTWDVANEPQAENVFKVVSTESRNLPTTEAAATIRKVLTRQRAHGGKLCFKKIDSTLRGPVGAELRVLIEALAPSLVVLCPANPQAGRTLSDGILKVNGVPLAETDFREDPIWPMQTSDVAELLRGQGATVSRCRLSIDDWRDKGNAAAATISEALKHPAEVLLADAETQADVEALVKVVRQHAPGAILVGSGALAAALAAEMIDSAPEQPQPRPNLKPMLLLCGSRHPASRRQFEHLARESGGEVIVAAVDDLNISTLCDKSASALATRGIAAVRFTLSGNETPEDARRLLLRIQEVTPSLLARTHPASLFLTGGETAWTVCQALQATEVEILEELAPGVVLSLLTTASGDPLPIVTKPGGFGGEALLSDCLSI